MTGVGDEIISFLVNLCKKGANQAALPDLKRGLPAKGKTRMLQMGEWREFCNDLLELLRTAA
jgi:hypothetical protein